MATTKGLDRFGDNRVYGTFFCQLRGSPRIGSSRCSRRKMERFGSVNRGSLDVLRGNVVNSIRIPGKRVTSLWQDHAKRLWVGVDNTLTIYDRGRFTRINRLDGSPLGSPVAITEDRDQNIWVSVVGRDQKLFRIHGLRVAEDFPVVLSPRLFAADPAGGIWLTPNGKLGHYRSGKLEMIPMQGNESIVRGLTVDADGSQRWKLRPRRGLKSSLEELVGWRHSLRETVYRATGSSVRFGIRMRRCGSTPNVA